MISGFGEERVDARLIHTLPRQVWPTEHEFRLAPLPLGPRLLPRAVYARKTRGDDLIDGFGDFRRALTDKIVDAARRHDAHGRVFGLHRGTVVAVVSRPSVEVRMQLAASSAVLRMVASSRKTFASMAISAAKDWLVLRRSPNATGAGLRLVGAPDGVALRRVLCANR